MRIKENQYSAPTQDKVIKFLKDNSPSSVNDISQFLGCSRANAHRVLQGLKKKMLIMEGEIQEHKQGRPHALYHIL